VRRQENDPFFVLALGHAVQFFLARSFVNFCFNLSFLASGEGVQNLSVKFVGQKLLLDFSDLFILGFDLPMGLPRDLFMQLLDLKQPRFPQPTISEVSLTCVR
jgi:hypothetical protein